MPTYTPEQVTEALMYMSRQGLNKFADCIRAESSDHKDGFRLGNLEIMIRPTLLMVREFGNKEYMRNTVEWFWISFGNQPITLNCDLYSF